MRRNKIVRMQKCTPIKNKFLFKIINKYILCTAKNIA